MLQLLLKLNLLGSFESHSLAAKTKSCQCTKTLASMNHTLSLQDILKFIRHLGFYHIISKKQNFRLCIISKKKDSLNSDDLYLETYNHWDYSRSNCFYVAAFFCVKACCLSLTHEVQNTKI